MRRTHRAPWDYNRRVPTPSDSLFCTCPNCGYKLAVKSGNLCDCFKCNKLNQPTLEHLEYLEELKALDILVGYVPPEPETPSAWEWPYQDDLGESPTDTRSQFSGF